MLPAPCSLHLPGPAPASLPLCCHVPFTSWDLLIYKVSAARNAGVTLLIERANYCSDWLTH